MTKLLLAYHSFDGQTTKIAERLADGLRARGVDVDLREVAQAPTPEGYDAVVVGDSIRLGRHSRAVIRWLRAQRSQLERLPLIVFQVSMTAAQDDEEHRKIVDGFSQELVRRSGVEPVRVENVAGALRYSQYGWVTRRVMRSIARREGNATDTTRDHEYTDWDAVDRFVDSIVATISTKVAGREESR